MRHAVIGCAVGGYGWLALLGCAGLGGPAPPQPTWNANAAAPCEELLFDGPVRGDARAVRLPACDLPEGSVREWLGLFGREADDPSSLADDGRIHRACPDGTYEQQDPRWGRPRILRGRLVDGKADGPFVLVPPHGGSSLLEAQFSDGAPHGRWAWNIDRHMSTSSPCISQSGEFFQGKRAGAWSYHLIHKGEERNALIPFVEGQVEGGRDSQPGLNGTPGLRC